jgi:outer membrane protein assembly factor BamB
LTARAAFFTVLVALAGAGACGCGRAAVPDLSFGTEPLTELDIDHGDGNRWLGVVRGASGERVEELPSGDFLLAGHAAGAFVQRIDSEGEAVWTFFMHGCGGPRIAVGGEDEIYVAMQALVAEGEAARTRRRDERKPCDSWSARAPTTILRLNGRGEVVWRTVIPDLVEPTLTLLAAPGRLIVVGAPGSAPPTSTLLGLSSRDGRSEWTRELPGSFETVRWLPTEETVIALGGGSSSLCSVRAFEATTGSMKWERSIGGERVNENVGCIARQLLVSSAGVIAQAEVLGPRGWSQSLYGLDTMTGADLFEADIEPFQPWLPPFAGRVSRELALFVDYYWPLVDPTITSFGPTILAIDPRSGRALPLARFEERLVDGTLTVSGVSWGRHALLVTGTFHGGLRLDDMEGETTPVATTRCQSIDPGFHVGPYPSHRKPEKPRYTSPPPRGWPRRICPELTFPERVHEYKTSLFVARLPWSSFDVERH